MNNKDWEKTLNNFMWFVLNILKALLQLPCFLWAQKKTAGFPTVSL